MDRVRKVSPLTAQRMCWVYNSVVSVPIPLTLCSFWRLTGSTQGTWHSNTEVMTGSELTVYDNSFAPLLV